MFFQQSQSLVLAEANSPSRLDPSLPSMLFHCYLPSRPTLPILSLPSLCAAAVGCLHHHQPASTKRDTPTNIGVRRSAPRPWAGATRFQLVLGVS